MTKEIRFRGVRRWERFEGWRKARLSETEIVALYFAHERNCDPFVHVEYRIRRDALVHPESAGRNV